MNPTAYYNENDPHAADWLDNLIAAQLIPYGHVDRRSITEVQPGDVQGFTQAHFFAGIGGWALACRYAGWPDSRPIWTGSAPCQPFSAAGRRRGRDDDRHLWPHFHRLIRGAGSAVIMGEQVAGKAGRDWFFGISTDLDQSSYITRAVDIPSCAVDSPNERNRIYWIAVAHDIGDGRGTDIAQRGQERRTVAGGTDAGDLANGEGQQRWTRDCQGHVRRDYGDKPSDGHGNVPMAHGSGVGTAPQPCDPAAGRDTAGGSDESRGSTMVHTHGERLEKQLRAVPAGQELGSAERPASSFWADAEWIECHDGKARRTKPGLPLLVTGISGRVAVSRTYEQGTTPDEEVRWVNRVGAWKGIGNAINPVLAAEVIRAYMETDGASRA